MAESKTIFTNDMLPVTDGKINLRTGQFTPSTTSTVYPYIKTPWKGIDYNTSCFDAYVNELMLGDQEKIKQLQEILGYAISGSETNICYNFYGIGSNGKTVFMNTLYKIMRPLSVRFYGIHDLQKDTRIAIAHDTPETKLNLVVLKQIMNHEPIIIRKLYQAPEKIQSDCYVHIFVESNEKLESYDSRRIKSIEFPTLFVKDDMYNPSNPKNKIADINIYQKLDLIEDQMLVWLVKGSIMWFKNHPEL